MRLDKKIEKLEDEIRRFRVETKNRLELIESEVRKQISLNYSRTIVDYVNRTTLDFTKCLTCQENKEIEQACKQSIISIKQNYIDLLKNGNLSESLKTLDEALITFNEKINYMTDKGNVGCIECFMKEIEVLKINKSFLTQLYELESSSTNIRENNNLVNQINPVEINENILNPICHKVRLQILLSIFRGGNRFNDFIEITGLKGGHLLYHINKLLEHEFIQQYASKDYVLTRKGFKTISLLSQMDNELRS